MDKYYTPSIEEFYVGFEYEYLTVNNEWVKDTFMSIKPEDTEQMDFNTIESILKDYPAELRVKYLDDEDIKSLGFEVIEGKWPGTRHVNYKRIEPINNRYLEIEVWHTISPLIMNIHVWSEDKELSGNVFRVKNKSELNDLMGKIIISIRG